MVGESLPYSKLCYGAGLGTSLAGKDFSSKDLRNQKFYKADMRGANFSMANMQGANLFGAYAKGAYSCHGSQYLCPLYSTSKDLLCKGAFWK